MLNSRKLQFFWWTCRNINDKRPDSSPLNSLWPSSSLSSRAEVEFRSTNTDSFKASLYSTWNIYIPCIYTYIHVYIYICMYIYLSPMFFTNKYSKSINPTYWIQQPIFLTWDGTKNTLSSLQQTFCKSKNANCKDSPSFIAQSWYTIAGWFICSL